MVQDDEMREQTKGSSERVPEYDRCPGEKRVGCCWLGCCGAWTGLWRVKVVEIDREARSAGRAQVGAAWVVGAAGPTVGLGFRQVPATLPTPMEGTLARYLTHLTHCLQATVHQPRSTGHFGCRFGQASLLTSSSSPSHPPLTHHCHPRQQKTPFPSVCISTLHPTALLTRWVCIAQIQSSSPAPRHAKACQPTTATNCLPCRAIRRQATTLERASRASAVHCPAVARLLTHQKGWSVMGQAPWRPTVLPAMSLCLWSEHTFGARAFMQPARIHHNTLHSPHYGAHWASARLAWPGLAWLGIVSGADDNIEPAGLDESLS